MKYRAIENTGTILKVLIKPDEKDIPFFERCLTANYDEGEHEKLETIIYTFVNEYSESMSVLRSDIYKTNGGYLVIIEGIQN